MQRILILSLLGTVLLFGGCQKKSEPPLNRPEGHPGPATMGTAERPAPPSARRANPAGPQLKPLWSTAGLKVPESIMYDPARKVLYVSCINGKPTEKNGQGFIAKLSAAGKILTLQWVKGMNAPKGMGLSGDTLYVTDIDRVHVIDVKAGKITKTVDAPGAKFLNDIAIGPKGRVFISDMVTGKVLVLKDGKLSVFTDLKPFKGANGMLMQGDHLRAGTATGIVTVDLATGKASLLVPMKGFGMIDGLKPYGKGAWLVSNWSGRTEIVRADGTVTVLRDTTAQKIQSADLEYLPASRTLLIPTFFNNHVMAFRLTP